MNRIYKLNALVHGIPSNDSLAQNIVCVIANYGFAENASHLKTEMSKLFVTYLVDSSSPETPPGTDIVIPNDYYPGLLKEAIRIAESGEFGWLLFIASDVEIPDTSNFQFRVREVTTDFNVGVYSPSVTESSRTAYPLLVNQSTGNLREVGIVEGFAFLTQVKLLNVLKKPLENSKFGWAVDVLLCYHAYSTNKIVIVDDNCIVFHPKSKSPIHEDLAMKEAIELIPKDVFDWKKSFQPKSRIPKVVRKVFNRFLSAK